MSAVVRARSHHTNVDDGGTAVDGTTIRFKTADNDTQNASNQMVRPGGSPTYSWIKQFTFYVSTAPGTSLSNLKAYMSGSAVTGVSIGAKTSVAYVDPTAQAATQLTGTTDAYTYTATAPLSINGSFTTATDTIPRHIGDFILLQLGVASTASLGTAVSVGSLVLRYDEI